MWNESGKTWNKQEKSDQKCGKTEENHRKQENQVEQKPKHFPVSTEYGTCKMASLDAEAGRINRENEKKM